MATEEEAQALRNFAWANQLVFVFGSNLAGRHGKGAALFAKQVLCAVDSQGEGMQGYAYAIPTKDAKLRTLELSVIRGHVEKFLARANDRPYHKWYVTEIGCGLAGYTAPEIAPLFAGAPPNCIFSVKWKPYIGAREGARWHRGNFGAKGDIVEDQ